MFLSAVSEHSKSLLCQERNFNYFMLTRWWGQGKSTLLWRLLLKNFKVLFSLVPFLITFWIRNIRLHHNMFYGAWINLCTGILNYNFSPKLNLSFSFVAKLEKPQLCFVLPQGFENNQCSLNGFWDFDCVLYLEIQY